jgi:hypothetical protein
MRDRTADCERLPFVVVFIRLGAIAIPTVVVDAVVVVVPEQKPVNQK